MARDGKILAYDIPPRAPDFTAAQIRAEMRQGDLFLLPPLVLACGLALAVQACSRNSILV